MIKPLLDYILIRKSKDTNKTESGIILVDNSQANTKEGVVEAVNPNTKELQVGDKVVYKPYAGFEVSTDRELLLVAEEDILLKVEV